MVEEIVNIEVKEYMDDIFDICEIPDDYAELIFFMFHKAFIWVRELDENRVRDVISILRFPRGFDEDEEEYPVSILEVFVAMSMRVASEVVGDNNPNKWFFLILERLGLDKFTNDKIKFEKVDFILDDFMHNNGNPSCKHDPFRIDDEKSGKNSPPLSGDSKIKSGDLVKTGGSNLDIWRQFCMFLTQKCL